MGETLQEDIDGNAGAHGQQCKGWRDAVNFSIGQPPSDEQPTRDIPPNNDDLDCIPPL